MKLTRKDIKYGFTLIELLVVVAIIALLAAILFPVFARAREKARQAACMSNMKQIGLGIMQYVQDNDERFPMSLNYNCVDMPGCGITSSPFTYWNNAIFPYVKNLQVFACPNHKNDNPQAPLSGTSPQQYFPISYKANTYGSTSGGGLTCGIAPMNYIYWGSGGTTASIVLIQVPAETMLINETNETQVYTQWVQGLCAFSGPASLGGCTGWGSSDGETLWSGHTGRANYLFADGHVKPLTPTMTNKTKNMWTIEDDGPCNEPMMNAQLQAAEAFFARSNG